jgi:sugar/nucleoside kinase (ribokinase family)
MSVLAVGTVAFDTIETPFQAPQRVLGGSASYITLAARYFAQDVRLVAVVGGDFPDAYRATLRDAGVDLDGLEVQPEGKTFAWEGRYHYDMNMRDTVATHLNVLATFKPKLPDAYRTSDIVCLGNLDPSVQLEVLRQAERPKLTILDTMNFWIDHTPDALREVLGKVDVLAANDAEVRQLAGEPNLITAARKVRAMGPQTLVVTKGEHGALLLHDEQIFIAPALPIENIQDPTGAGDTFLGGFAGYLDYADEITLDTIKAAVVYGSVMASHCVEAFGPARMTALDDEAIRERARAFRDLSAVPHHVSETLFARPVAG